MYMAELSKLVRDRLTPEVHAFMHGALVPLHFSTRPHVSCIVCADFVMGDAPKDGDESEQDEAKPTKIVMEELTLEVRARCMQLDYEGRSDGRSMHTILSHIAPRHLVLCHGSSKVCLLLTAQYPAHC